MTDRKLTVEEMTAWMAINNPTSSWNSYHRVNKTENGVQCFRYTGIGSTRQEMCDLLTKEQFVQLAGFRDWDHYKEVKHIKENEPLKFEDLRPWMVIRCETERRRLRIKYKDKDRYAVDQQGASWWSRAFSSLSRADMEAYNWVRSKAPVHTNIREDMEHAKHSEYATD